MHHFLKQCIERGLHIAAHNVAHYIDSGELKRDWKEFWGGTSESPSRPSPPLKSPDWAPDRTARIELDDDVVTRNLKAEMMREYSTSNAERKWQIYGFFKARGWGKPY